MKTTTSDEHHVNWGCLLFIAASLLIDGLTLSAAVSLARMSIGG